MGAGDTGGSMGAGGMGDAMDHESSMGGTAAGEDGGAGAGSHAAAHDGKDGQVGSHAGGQSGRRAGSTGVGNDLGATRGQERD